MYNVYNPSEVFYLYDIFNQTTRLIGNEKELINFLAKAYTQEWYGGNYYYNTYFDNFACSQGDVIATTKWQFLDGMDRCINPKTYERSALSLWNKKYKNKQGNLDYRHWKKKHSTYKGVFRQTPVEGIHNYNGGPSSKKPLHIAHYWRMHGNPEYKEFNRGNRISIWHDPKRHVEKNWKSQRKHQWKEVKNM